MKNLLLTVALVMAASTSFATCYEDEVNAPVHYKTYGAVEDAGGVARKCISIETFISINTPFTMRWDNDNITVTYTDIAYDNIFTNSIVEKLLKLWKSEIKSGHIPESAHSGIYWLEDNYRQSEPVPCRTDQECYMDGKFEVFGAGYINFVNLENENDERIEIFCENGNKGIVTRINEEIVDNLCKTKHHTIEEPCSDNDVDMSGWCGSSEQKKQYKRFNIK